MKSLSVTSLLLGKRFIGVEHFTRNGKEMTAFAEISKSKDELTVVQQETFTATNIPDGKWDKKLPFYLAVATDQVIQKTVNSTDPSDEKLLYKAFPNLDREAFYYEIWRLKTSAVIAISRISYINDIIADYNKQNISITGVSLGVTSISELENYSGRQNYTSNSFEVSSQEGFISPREVEEIVIHDLNGLKIENAYLLAFASALRLILQRSATTGNVSNYNFSLNDGYLQKAFFSTAFKFILGFLLAILLINFFSFSHYFKKDQELSENIAIVESTTKQMGSLKERVKQKEERLKNSEREVNSKSSLFINEITRLVPHSILLSELVFNPIEKKVKPEEAIVIAEKSITITGKTLSNHDFTTWVESIENLSDVNQVIISEFGKNDQNETIFSIRLNLKK